MTDKYIIEKKIITRISAIGYQQNYFRTGGNLSIRVGNKILITPTGMSSDFMCDLSPELLIEIPINNGSYSSEIIPSRELAIHLMLYKLNKLFKGIVHAHPPYLLTFSDNFKNFTPLTHSANKFGEILICKHEPRLGQDLSTIVESKINEIKSKWDFKNPYGFCIFVPWHGVFIASKTIQQAYYFLNKIEENAFVLKFKN